MDRRNVTITLPAPVIMRARHLAVEKGVSLSRLLSEVLEEMVRADDVCRRASQRIRRRLARGFDLGSRGRAAWTREELHER